MAAVTLVVLAALVVKVIDFFKQLQNKQWNAALTQVIVWVAGWVVLLLTAQTQFAVHLVIEGIALDKASVWDLLLMGLALGSTGSAGWQALANLGGGSHEVAAPLFPQAARRQVVRQPSTTVVNNYTANP